MLKLSVVSIESFPSHLAETLIKKLNNKKASRFHFAEDRYRHLAGELLARTMIGETKGITPSDLLFERNRYGRPFVSQLSSELDFNISHAGTWVAVVVSTKAAVGVDVEKKSSLDLSLAERFFASIEYQFINKQRSEEQAIDTFYQIWTYKESYIKAVGKGLSIPLDSFTTVMDEEMVRELRGDEQTWFFTPIHLEAAYCMTVCSSLPFVNMKVEIRDIQELIKDFLSP